MTADKSVIDEATKLLTENGHFVTKRENWYDRKDMVKMEACLGSGMVKIAAYQVRDPEDGEWSPLQYHMTYGNTVMCVMGAEAAKLFARFVSMNGDYSESEIEAKRYDAARFLAEQLKDASQPVLRNLSWELARCADAHLLSDNYTGFQSDGDRHVEG